MGRPPAVVIIARHGARLDAADTQWHLTSPTPYDPPLTYGGWRQSQALGARIASIINAREANANAPSLDGLDEHMGRLKFDGDSGENKGRGYPSHREKRRKHKIVIHTSPFQRCVETSIAISAGIAQYQAPASPTTHQTQSRPYVMHSGSPIIQAKDGRNSQYLSAIAEPEDPGRSIQKRKPYQTLLRVDPFLGEWLSPEYFDKITPPPESKMMVASSKAYLRLHHGDPVNLTQTSNRNLAGQGNFPGGWHSGIATASDSLHSDHDAAPADLSGRSRSIPRLGRASSHSLGSSPKGSDLTFTQRTERSQSPENPTYVPPMPSYAISPSQPIPSGYVSHACEACVQVDNMWDSLRPPLEWGSGGDYGEEWSALHKRFRRGLSEMISWYRSHEESETLKPVRDDSLGFTGSDTEDPQDFQDCDESNTDIILILVTHGAGCNALIGALTSQPVLLDVGMASLTLAVRKSVAYKRVSSPQAGDAPVSPSRRRHSLADSGIAEDYEVKLTASTEHLRAGSPFLAGPQPQRTANFPIRDRSPYSYERPGFLNNGHHRFSPTKEGSQIDNPPNENFGGLQRSATAVVPSSRGLWSMPASKQVGNPVKQESRPLSLQATQGHPHPVKARNADAVQDYVEIDRRERLNGSMNSGRTSPTSMLDHASQGHSIAPNGLWGAPPQALGTERDKGSKRRWTHSQAS